MGYSQFLTAYKTVPMISFRGMKIGGHVNQGLKNTLKKIILDLSQMVFRWRNHNFVFSPFFLNSGGGKNNIK